MMWFINSMIESIDEQLEKKQLFNAILLLVVLIVWLGAVAGLAIMLSSLITVALIKSPFTTIGILSIILLFFAGFLSWRKAVVNRKKSK